MLQGDSFHRHKWREDYPQKWLMQFQKFCEYASKNDISIIAGISPGIDLNFNTGEIKKEIAFLVQKIKLLKKFGAHYIAILFDDVPNNKTLIENGFKTDGFHHADLVNYLGDLLKINIFVVPKIYALELKKTDYLYIPNFFKKINKQHVIFCGKKIISKKSKDLFVPNECENQIIFWDNIFANDYCPRKLLIGPWKYRKNLNSIMVNPTGLKQIYLY